MGFELHSSPSTASRSSASQSAVPQRIVLFYNPASRGGDNYLQDVEELRRTGLEIDSHETSPHTKDNIAVLAEVGQAGDINAWLGGDGTLSAGLTAARRAE